MPIYEYRCQNCQRRCSLLFQTFAAAARAQCPTCGSPDLKKLVSRVSVVKSEESRLEALSDPSNLGGVDENDPKSVARFMRKMGGEMGEDMGPEFGEMVDRLESGESPEEIEKTMPGMGSPDGPVGGMGSMGDDF